MDPVSIYLTPIRFNRCKQSRRRSFSFIANRPGGGGRAEVPQPESVRLWDAGHGCRNGRLHSPIRAAAGPARCVHQESFDGNARFEAALLAQVSRVGVCTWYGAETVRYLRAVSRSDAG